MRQGFEIIDSKVDLSNVDEVGYLASLVRAVTSWLGWRPGSHVLDTCRQRFQTYAGYREFLCWVNNG